MANDNATNYGVAPKTAPNVCEVCGVENPPGEEKCLKCGASLEKKEDVSASGYVSTASADPKTSSIPPIPSAPPLG